LYVETRESIVLLQKESPLGVEGFRRKIRPSEVGVIITAAPEFIGLHRCSYRDLQQTGPLVASSDISQKWDVGCSLGSNIAGLVFDLSPKTQRYFNDGQNRHITSHFKGLKIIRDFVCKALAIDKDDANIRPSQLHANERTQGNWLFENQLG
jgi:hypothetical protein